MKPAPLTDPQLHAYLDGELPPEEHAAVAAALAEQPQAAARLAAWQTQREALHAHFDAVLDEPLPPALLALTQDPGNPAGRTPGKPRRFFYPSWQRWQGMAASVLLLLLGGAGGWLARDRSPAGPPPTPIYHAAAVAHTVFAPDVRRPVEVDGEHQEQLVTWLSKRLGTPVFAPLLTAQGYSLVGGRLLPGNSGPVAQFMYQDDSGQRLTLYLSTTPAGQGDTAFRFAREGQLGVFYWVDGRFNYALTGALERPQLAHLASAVYEQLERRTNSSPGPTQKD